MDLKEMLGKKKALDPDMKDAKLRVLKDMKKVASDAMSDDIKGTMAKATVIGKSPEDLAKGLDKAKEIVKHEAPEMEAAEEETGMDLDADDEVGESPEHISKVLGASESGYETGDEEGDVEEMLERCDTPEKIDELMMKLAEKKRAMKA